ncbi:MAG: 4-alpha-glucanotransferase [Erysipelotrichaceae bacterium]|nr:4-alpha-glucanotransferase [Erysipelotrichaceae bacterium]
MKKVGILLPFFSLPNKYGIGTLGKSAYDFVDFLSLAKQDYWQVLPTNPTSYGDSPYQSFSVFAQNPYFIDLEYLVADHLLTKKDLNESYLANDTNKIDYGNIFYNKMRLLKKAYQKHNLFNDEFETFKNENKFWLFDYALFMVLKEHHNNKAWNEWDECYKYRNKDALNAFCKENKEAIEAYMFMQYLYFKQYNMLLKYAHSKNILIIGDTPIYVAYDSVDVWKNPEMFLLDEKYNPTLVAGVPPDYFSATGQLWGNPLYNYQQMEENNFSWWVKRVEFSLKLFDYLRIDHFRGFSAFYAIPFGSENAINGHWIEGPKMKLFNAIKNNVKPLNIIAENLGLLDDDVYKLIDDCTFPGMRILEFEMYSKDNLNQLKNISANNIIYPGTHDNNTFVGWYNHEASEVEKANVNDELQLCSGDNIAEKLLKYGYTLPQDYFIISLQDILGLDSDARINIPGSNQGNWQYIFKEKDFNDSLAIKIASIKDACIK